MTREEALQYRAKVVDGEKVAEMGGFVVTTAQSDKVGFDWKITSINDVEVVKEYVEQENPVGVESNPFTWVAGMDLIVNAFYNANGKKYVAIEAGNPTEITDEYFTEF